MASALMFITSCASGGEHGGACAAAARSACKLPAGERASAGLAAGDFGRQCWMIESLVAVSGMATMKLRPLGDTTGWYCLAGTCACQGC